VTTNNEKVRSQTVSLWQSRDIANYQWYTAGPAVQELLTLGNFGQLFFAIEDNPTIGSQHPSSDPTGLSHIGYPSFCIMTEVL
jgi:hypothetical protein